MFEQEEFEEVNQKSNSFQEKKYKKDYQDDERDQLKQQNEKYLINTIFEDQKRMKLNAEVIGLQASDILDRDFQSYQQKVIQEMKTEKNKFLQYLEKQEKLLKTDVNRRVFSIVNEIQEIKEQEDQFIDDQIRLKKGQVHESKSDKSKKEANYDLEVKRKEILVKQAALNPIMNIQKLIEIIPDFENLKEDQKRQVYQSVKVGQNQELAKIELYKYENEPGKTQSLIKKAQVKAQVYQNLLKQILPIEFKNEYLSLKEIQKKKDAAEKAFLKAQNEFKNQISKIKEQRYEIQKHKNILNDYDMTNDSVEYLLADNKSNELLISYQEFQNKVKKIDELKSYVDKIKQLEITDITQNDRDIEKSNQSQQIQAEQDAEQQKNLLLLLLNINNELNQKMKSQQIQSADRRSQASSKDGDKNDKILFDAQKLIDSQVAVSFKQQREEFVSLLKKYKVDPQWLQNQQTKHLQEYMDEQSESLIQRALQIENDLVTQEKQNIISMINRKLTSNEIKQYLLNSLKSQSFVQGVNEYYGQEDQLLNEIIIAQIQSQLEQQDFNATEFIMKKLNKNDFEKQNLSKPKSHQSIKELQIQNEWISANQLDRVKQDEVLDYEKYKFRQIKQLHIKKLNEDNGIKEGLFQQMSLTKQRAWYNIYNDYLQNQKDYVPPEFKNRKYQNSQIPQIEFKNKLQLDSVQNEKDFYDLFQNWEFKAFLLQGNFEDKEVKNIEKTLKYMQDMALVEKLKPKLGEKAYEVVGVQEEPNLAATYNEIINIIQKDMNVYLSVREDELYIENDTNLSQYENFKKIQFRNNIKQKEDFVADFHDEYLQQNDMFYLYDKVEGVQDHDLIVKTFEGALKQLDDLKKEFTKKYGVHVHNFNPVEIRLNQKPQEPHKEIISLTGNLSDEKYIIDQKLVYELIEKTYKEQFPKDPNMQKYVQNMPNFKISEEIREKIKEHLYNEQIQEQYFNAIHNETGILEDPKQIILDILYDKIVQNNQSDQDDISTKYYMRRMGEDLDDELIKRIDFHLNEKHQQNIKIIDKLEMPGDQSTKVEYDIRAFEQMKKDMKGSNLSDYEEQQHLLFRQRHKQALVNKALQSRDQSIFNQQLQLEKRIKQNQFKKNLKQQEQIKNIEQDLLNSEKLNVQNKKKYLERLEALLGHKLQENKDLNQEQGNEQETVEVNIEQKSQDSKIQNFSNFLKSLQGDSQQDTKVNKLVSDLILIYESNQKKYQNQKSLSVRQAQKVLLKEDLQNQTDPYSLKIKQLIKDKSQFDKQNIQRYKDLEDYINIDQFSVNDKHPEFENARELEELQEQEEQIMIQMANEYQQFDMNQIVQQVQLLKVAYTGESWKSNDKLSSVINAFSSTQIIQAAQSQILEPHQQKLALLYDPFNPVREEYLRTKYQMYINSKIRQDMASKIIQAQNILSQAQFSKQKYEIDAQKIIDRFSGQVLPKKAFELIPQQLNKTQSEKEAHKLKSKDIIQRINKFDPFSQEISNYNDELKFHLTSLKEFTYNELSQGKKNDFNQQIFYILKQMKENNIKLDEQSHSLLFQINLEMNELDKATQNLKSILIIENQKQNTDHLYIQQDSLRSFYETSISRDNFEGLAHLITFLEKKGTDISEWNMLIFRSAVDFYLNHTFNINHIFTFTRFYIQHAKSCLSSKQNIKEHLPNIEQQTPEVLAIIHKEIFGQLENIVDMNLLFQHLVNKVGSNTLLDPISKVDPIQNIIDFFSIKEIQAIQKYSELSSTFINDDDISQYYANNLSNPESFQKIFDQVLKFNDNQYFITNIIKILRDYAAQKDGKLPKSFQNTEKIQKLYLQIKSSLQNNIKISEKTAEFLFFLFKMNKMNSETLDLSQNYDKIVEGYQNIEEAQQKSNIRNYYMSETLFNFEIDQNKQSFNKLVEEAVYSNSKDNSEAYISSMVKAYMLDGNIDYALQFFKTAFDTRKSNHQQQQETLVKLFDQIFGNINNSQIGINDFKNRYFNLMEAREQLKNEASIVKQLDKILNNCDPEEIDCMFKLQALLREEHLILTKLCDISKKDYHYIQSQFQKCSNDQESVNEFVNNLASKYTVLAQNPQLLKEFQLQLIQQKINVDLLKNNQSDNENIKNFQSREEQQFTDLLFKIKQKYGNQEIKKSLQKKMDQMTVKDWIEILQEKNIIEKAEQEQRLISKVQKELLIIKDRKEVLDLKIKNQNKEQLMNLLKQQNNNQVQILENVQDVDQILQSMGISLEEINSYKKYEKQKDYIDSVILSMKIESDEGPQMISEQINSSIIDAFKSSVQQSTSQEIDFINKFKVENDLHISLVKRFEMKYGLKNLQRIIKKGFYSRHGKLRRKEDIKVVDFYRKYLHEDVPDDNTTNWDEEILVKDKIYDLSLEQFEDELRQALDSRRVYHLPFAIQEFNKIQNKQMPMWLQQESEINSQQQTPNQSIEQDIQQSDENQNIEQKTFTEINSFNIKEISKYQNQQQKTDQYVQQNHKMQDPALINETMERYDYLLNDSQSPIISNFLHLLEYNDGSDIMNYNEFYEQHKEGKSKQYLSKYLKQSEQLETLSEQVDKIIGVSNDMVNLINQQHQKLVNEVESAQQFQVEFTQKRESNLQNIIDNNVKQLYQQLISEQDVKIENASDNKDKNQIESVLINEQFLYKQQFSRDQKVSFMKQALSFELGGFKTYEIFNSFFAEDFIVFGMQNNIPEAVRLGEYLLSEQNYVLSKDMQKALKNYKLKEGEKYREAIKKTGPIDINKIYKNAYNEDPSSEKYSKSSIVNMDDPYWREFIDRNYRAQDGYKIPSAYAWDHKDNGIFGDIFDFKDLQKKKLLFEQL